MVASRDAQVAATFSHTTAADREEQIVAERAFTDAKVKKIIELKKHMCTEENGGNEVSLRIWCCCYVGRGGRGPVNSVVCCCCLCGRCDVCR